MNSRINHLSFTKRAIPIPADYRPLFKIGHILLILSLSCRGNKSSLMRLHFFCWAIKSEGNMSTVNDWIKNNFNKDFHIWGIEPTVNRAIVFAAAEQLIEDSGGDYSLTSKGENLSKLIQKDKLLFPSEKAFLVGVGKNTITELRIKELMSKFI